MAYLEEKSLFKWRAEEPDDVFEKEVEYSDSVYHSKHRNHQGKVNPTVFLRLGIDLCCVVTNVHCLSSGRKGTVL